MKTIFYAVHQTTPKKRFEVGSQVNPKNCNATRAFAVRPKDLKIRLEKDFKLSHSNTKMDHKIFMGHATDLSIAIGKLMTGPSESLNSQSRDKSESFTGKNKNNSKRTAVQTVEIRLQPAETEIRAEPFRFASFPLAPQKPSVIIPVTVRLQRTRRNNSWEKKVMKNWKGDGPVNKTHSTNKSGSVKMNNRAKAGRITEVKRCNKTSGAPACKTTLCDGSTTVEIIG